MQNTKFPKNYPDEYKSGFVEFLGKKFFVSPDVLIPRLETEVLIKYTKKLLKNFSKNPKILVDIGTGSGIIGTSLREEIDEIFFIDISEKALKMAQKNYFSHFSKQDTNLHFLKSSLLENFDIASEQEIFFVANLPYIKNEDWKNMSEDTVFEPKIALFGGEKTGFELYERLFEQIQKRGFHGNLIIEFGFDQRQWAEKILQQYPQWKVGFFADYANIERFAHICF